MRLFAFAFRVNSVFSLLAAFAMGPMVPQDGIALGKVQPDEAVAAEGMVSNNAGRAISLSRAKVCCYQVLMNSRRFRRRLHLDILPMVENGGEATTEEGAGSMPDGEPFIAPPTKSDLSFNDDAAPRFESGTNGFGASGPPSA